MNAFTKLSTAAVLATLLVGCNATSSKPTGPDLGTVLDRTVMVLEYAEANFEKTEDETEGEAQLKTLTSVMHQAMNAAPSLNNNQAVGVSLREDAAFLGFADKNGNNVSDPGEKDLFTVEIDAERKRIIATDLTSGEGTYRVSGSGLLLGYMAGRLLGRQGRAGVNSSSFANRNVKSSSEYRKSRPTPRAKTKTRSGSSRVGK